MVHISCCIGNVCSRMFAKYRNNEAKKREVLSACCAAAIAVAFGAPVGGVLFSLEEASSYFPPRTLWRSLFCSIIGVLTVKVLHPEFLELLNITHDQGYYWFELIPLCLVGVLGGIFGAFFVKIGIAYNKLRRRTIISKFPVLECVVVILITATLTFWNRYSRMSNHDVLRMLFRECALGTESQCDWTAPALLLLLVCGIIKYLLFLLTFALRVPAGLFVPSLTIGAIFGYLFGFLVKFIQETFSSLPLFMECPTSGACIVPGIYALVGAAVMLGGVTRITVSIVVITMEVTGRLSYAVPIMLSVLIAKWVADLFGHESFYELIININGYPYLDNKVEIDIDGEARDMMKPIDSTSIITIRGNSIETLQQAIKAQPSGNLGFAVVTTLELPLLVGFIHTANLSEAVARAQDILDVTRYTPVTFSRTDADTPGVLNLSDFMDHTSMHIFDDTPIYRVYDLFKAMGLRYLLIICEGVLVGIITKKDCLEFVARFRHGNKAQQDCKPQLKHTSTSTTTQRQTSLSAQTVRSRALNDPNSQRNSMDPLMASMTGISASSSFNSVRDIESNRRPDSGEVLGSQGSGNSSNINNSTTAARQSTQGLAGDLEIPTLGISVLECSSNSNTTTT